MFLIANDEGSDKLVDKFEQGTAQLTELQFGDIVFTGNGPDGDVLIGVEYKQVSDLAGCIRSGRLTGTQIPGMMKAYDFCFLLVEGNYQADAPNGKLIVPFKGGNGIRYGLQYSAFDNFLTSLSVLSPYVYGKSLIVKKSMNIRDTIEILWNLYAFFSKPWNEHNSMCMLDKTKMQRQSYEIDLVRAEPGSAGYPKFVLRKALLQIKGFSWEIAGQMADKFGTLESAMIAPQSEWIGDGIGKVLANRAYEALHGHPDPTAKVTKRRKEPKVNA